MRGTSGRTGGRGRSAASTGCAEAPQEGWERWWARNRDAWLWDADPAPVRRFPTTAAGRSSLSVARPVDAAATDHTPGSAAIYTRIVPCLLALLEREDDPALLREAALALGRVVTPEFSDPAADALVELLSHDDLSVARSATLALGLLGTDEALAPLIELARCSQAGHALCHRAEVPDSIRSTAALALGLLDDAGAVSSLVDLAERLPDGDAAMRAAAVLGLGLLHGDAATAQAGPWLAARCADRRLPLDVQVSLPTALGRLAPDGAADALLALLADRDVDAPTAVAGVTALGSAARADDERALDVLLDAAEKARDMATRQQALVGVARLAASAGDDPRGRPAVQAVAQRLLRELRRPTHSIDRPWIALASGVLVHGRPELRPRFADPLREAFDDASDPRQRGAHGLALGLAGVADARDELLEAFRDAHDDALAGQLAQALGLLGDPAAAPALRTALLSEHRSVTLRGDLALALCVLGDEQASADVARRLTDADGSSEERRGLTRALGTLRHRDGLDALLASCDDERLDERSRAAAVAALGRLAEKTSAPFTARLTAGTGDGYRFEGLELLLPDEG